MEQRVALRYAQALMDLANERDLVEQFSTDITTIDDVLESSKELRAMLHSPVIRPHLKHEVLQQIFAKHISKELLNFLELLVKKGRGELLRPTVVEFRKLVDTKQNVLRAKVTSAVELSEDQRKAIQSRLASLTGQTVVPSYFLDPSLKGGFIARIGDTQIDASLKHQLEVLREQFRSGSALLN
ncbi:MAG TPA: ATP synthase F1 subunit delta [Candidatus Kapabacteria bacterium]|nr:ATP synthase F1 subunit delta [Candidatus Kapabacteria bacterium]